MGVKKRVSAFLLAVLLSFGVCAVDYLQVDALEVGGSVVWDTAINYLLGLLGLSPITENGDKIVDFDSMRSKWVQDYEAYFYANVKPEDLPEGYTKERAYQNWIDNVCRGNLNTVEYGAWDIFKEWAETLPIESSGGGSSGVVLGVSTCSETASFILDYLGISYSSIGDPFYNVANNIVYAYIFVTDSSGNLISANFSTSDTKPSFSSYSSANNLIAVSGFSNPKVDFSYSSNRNQYELGLSYGGVDVAYFSTRKVYYAGISNSYSFSNMYDLSGEGSVSGSTDYAVVNDKITDLQIINDYSTTTTQNVVSIDWDRIGSMISDAVGTVTGSLDRTITDALDDAQEKVAAGTMSVSNYNDYVTEISNTYVYDITNETSITNPDSTVTGVVSGNVENAEFVLKGLQYVFPFCIPWDIKDFVTLLVADPVAPVIEYPIYNPVTDTDEIITIDFSLWENQVRIIRYIFDFLLIIGLLLLARSLIGAGGE